MEITVNTNLADALITVINDLCAKFGIAFDWTAANVWPRIEELAAKFISYKIAINWVGIAIPFVIFAILLVLAITGEKKDWDDDLRFVIWLFCGIAGLVTGGFIIANAASLVRCYTFPEYEILKYLKSLGVI